MTSKMPSDVGGAGTGIAGIFQQRDGAVLVTAALALIAPRTRVASATYYLLALELGMAEQQHEPASELQRLSAAAAQTHLRAIRSQIAIGFTFCSLAESELQGGRAVNAHNGLFTPSKRRFSSN